MMDKREELARTVGSTLCGEKITAPNGYDYRVVDAILDALMEPSEDAQEDAAEAFHGVVDEKKALFATDKYQAAGLTYRGVCPADWTVRVWQAILTHIKEGR